MMAETIRDLRGVSFAQVESELLRDPEIPDPLIRLYSVLLTYGPVGIFPGQERLAANTGCSRETVNRRLRQLRDLGLIAWTQRPGSSNDYVILGYAHHLEMEGVIPASQGGVSPRSHLSKSGVIPASQGVCPPDHRGCDPPITRSRSHDLDPPSQRGDPPVGALWAMALDDLERQMTRETFATWIRPCSLGSVIVPDDPASEAEAVVLCPTEYVQDWLVHRLNTPIQRTLGACVGQPVRVEYRVGVPADVAGA